MEWICTFNVSTRILISDRISVFVEWDYGALIIYKCHTHVGQDVILVSEPRVLRDEIIAVGCCVKRGIYFH